MTALRRPMALAAVALLALGVSGCRLGVSTDVELAADGSAVVGIALRIDGSMRVELDRLALDPTLAIDAALAGDDGWRRRRTIDDDGGLVLAFERDVADPAELSRLLSDLADGVMDEAPALEVDLDVVPGQRGAVVVDGRAGLRPPSTAGARLAGVPIGPSGDELAELVARVVDVTLSVTLPGPVVEHDADRLEGRTLTWELPVGATRELRAVGAPVPWWASGRLLPVPLRGGLALLALGAMGAAGVVLRRRRAARRGSPSGGPEARADRAGD
ncbi:MAG: hypothetical protein RLZZ272_264 [Actinomycetota bacterium]